MKILVWHWGRRGAGPLFAVRLAEAIGALPKQEVFLSLAAGAEILTAPDAPLCAWAEPTYGSRLGYVRARLGALWLRRRTRQNLAALAPDIALCAMPALLDGRLRAALRALRIPYAVIVHDAQAHPGDGFGFHLLEQNQALRGAAHIFCLTAHVAAQLRAQGHHVTQLWHPLIGLDQAQARPPPAGPLRLLHFGRLLPYKGLDLLEHALAQRVPMPDFTLRICGEGPATPTLARLAALPFVQLANRWHAEAELPGLLGWAEAMVLPYREASQSGVAAMALAAGLPVLATNVGGLAEQLGNAPGARLCAPEAGALALGLAELLASLRACPVLAPRPAAADWQAMAARLLAALTN